MDVDNALKIRGQLMKTYEAEWPDSFHRTLKRSVTTMSSNRKAIKVDGTPVYDTELIYTRVIGLQQSRDLDIKDVLSYELSAIPPALFDEHGDITHRINPPDVIIIDGCALLWCVHWPSCGTVLDYLKNFKERLDVYLQKSCVYLIFDRYPAKSTKGATRSNRAGQNASRKHVLTFNTPLPSQKVVLNVTHNKTQLIDLLTKYLVDHLVGNSNCEIVITSGHPVPVQIRNGHSTPRIDLHNTHEEEDVIIVNQLVNLALSGVSNISVICDDTDVFILLLYFYNQAKLICTVTMESPIAGRCAIDIKATAKKHTGITDFLPGAHALSGCDTTSYLFGICKATALKCINSGITLLLLGMVDVNMDEVVAEATLFMSRCYGSKYDGDMSEIRYAVWSAKMSNTKITIAPKLKSLPPTSDSFTQHVFRAHYQTMIWKSALSSGPPSAANPLRYGWTETDNILLPIMIPEDVSPVPVEVLQMIKCGCTASQPCSTGRCSCVTAQLACSIFCRCHGNHCYSKHTRSKTSYEDDKEDDD